MYIAVCIYCYMYTCRAFAVDMDKLCKGNKETNFRIECWDEDTGRGYYEDRYYMGLCIN